MEPILPPFLLIFSEFGVWRVTGETFGVAHPAVDKAHDADKNPERENQKSTGTGGVCAINRNGGGAKGFLPSQ